MQGKRGSPPQEMQLLFLFGRVLFIQSKICILNIFGGRVKCTIICGPPASSLAFPRTPHPCILHIENHPQHPSVGTVMVRAQREQFNTPVQGEQRPCWAGLPGERSHIILDLILSLTLDPRDQQQNGQWQMHSFCIPVVVCSQPSEVEVIIPTLHIRKPRLEIK